MHLEGANRKLEQEIGARERLNAPIESPLRHRLTFGFVVAVLLTIFMGFSSWRGARLAADDADWVAHSYTVMNRIELTSKHVIEMETSARGYAMGGQDSLLAHYESARDTVAQDENALRHLTADNPNQQRRLDVLKPQVHVAIDFAETMVATRQQTHAELGDHEILESARLLDALSATTEEMLAEETRLLTQRSQITKAGRRLTSFIIVVGVFVGATLLALARLAINREIGVSARARAQIGILNSGLEQRVEERTAALESEIAERKRAEEAVKESLATSERTLKELADQKFALDQHAIVEVTDVQGTITYVNDKFCAISQYSEDELIGQNHRILKSGHHPDEFFQQMYGDITNGKVWHGEVRNRAKDGSMYWVDTTIVPFLGEDGKPRQYVSIRADITERKLAQKEIQELNDELEHRVVERTAQLEASNKELEAFSYSVSHDLRAPLRHISGFSRMLVEEFGSTLDPNAYHYLVRIQAGTKEMGLLVDGLLDLARVGRHALSLQPTRLNSIVADVIAILQPESEGRQVEWVIADLPAVECDPVLVRQVFQNLLANALKFTRPRVGADRARVGTPAPASHTVIEVSHKEDDDGQWVFMVRDNGVGFSMKYVDKLFGVFQRLHSTDEFEGTGIGLVTVQRIVHKHGGRVWAEGEPDKGATFYFTLGVKKQAESKSNAATAGGQS
jgi:PAS domain S-box-containing protein